MYKKNVANARKMYYNAMIMTSDNRSKTTWNIIKQESQVPKSNKTKVSSLSSDELNLFFSSIADQTILSIPKTSVTNETHKLNPHSIFFVFCR
jgi:hypothetical protein